MVKTTSGHPAYLVGIVLALLFQIQGSAPFEQKVEDVCHSPHECGYVQLTCDADQRLAIVSVSHAHHENISAYTQCPSSVSNCSAVPSECCSKPSVAGKADCTEDYPVDSGVLQEAHKNCSARISSQGPVVCDLGLPSSPQPSRAGCLALDPYFQNLSSYSTVNYTCINETDVVPMCTASQRTGDLLYTLWSGRHSNATADIPDSASCRCSITAAAPGSAATLVIRTVDARIRNRAAAGTIYGRHDCSYVTVSEGGRTRLTTSCETDTAMFFEATSGGDGLMDVTTPTDIILTLSAINPPDMVWFSIMGLNREGINVTCYDAVSTATPRKRQPETDDDSGTYAVVAAAISAGVGMVILILIGFLCSHVFKKKRKQKQQVYKRRVSKSWWEQTREADRIAELSQIGPASRVIVDTGRNMRYGKHPVTRTYKTSDTNPPIYIVPGTAFPPPPPSDADAESVTRDPEGEHNHHHGESGGAGSGLEPEPLVFYSAAAGSGQVIIIPPEPLPPVKKYDIPPLTIKELED